MYFILTTLISLSLFLVNSINSAHADPAPAGLHLFMNYSTFCGGLGGIPAGTIYQCYDSAAGGVSQQLPGAGSYSVFANKPNAYQFAVALWSKDTVATVKTEKGYTIQQSWGKLDSDPSAPYVNVKDQTGYVLYDAVSYPEYGAMQLPWNPHA